MVSPIQGEKIFPVDNLSLSSSQTERPIEALPLGKEEGFSSRKYALVAVSITAVAGVVFSLCMPVALGLSALGAWYFWSAAIITINRASRGSRIERLVHRLHAAAMEVNAGVAAAMLFPWTLRESFHSARGNLQGKPILMVNGYFSFGSTWHDARERLVAAGLGPIYTINIGSGYSIKEYAKQLQEKVSQIQQETGRKDLALIGHSKGGLVSAYYAMYLAEEQKAQVTDVITIASPLAGTSLAHFGPGDDAYEMRPGSSFHQDLRDKIATCAKTRFFHIASQADEIVPVSSALLGKYQERQFVLDDMGHLGLVFSSRVAAQLSHWLKS